MLLGLFAMVVANYRHLLRPEMYSVILLLAELLILETHAAGARTRVLLWCIPIALLWANLHGAFLLGPVLALIYAAGSVMDRLMALPVADRRQAFGPALRNARPLVATALAMVLASLANPEGWHLLAFPFIVHASGTIRDGVLEWMPTLSPMLAKSLGVIIFEIALALTVAIVLPLRRHLDWTRGLLLLAFTLLALDRHRFMVFFGFIALLVLAHLLARWPGLAKHERMLLAASVVGGCAGAVTVLNFSNATGCRPWDCDSSDNMTVLISAALAKPEIQGNMLTSYELGAEVVYRAWPRIRPSIDSRIDSYGDQYFQMHRYVTYDDKTMDEYTRASDIKYILLTWRDLGMSEERPLLKANWHRIVADHRMILLQRNDITNASGSTGPTSR
jgi:hypothetical protein